MSCILREGPGDLLGDGGGTVVSGTETVSATPDIGSRVRTLRKAAGMTQEELADGRFTKQYVSQIERGEIVPSAELTGWIAERLGVERMLLETGLAAADVDRVRQELEQGERLLAEHCYPDAVEHFRTLRESLPAECPAWAYDGSIRGEALALIRLGRLDEGRTLLDEARRHKDARHRAAAERAELEYLTALLAYAENDIVGAQERFAEALALLDQAGAASDTLRCDIYRWRSRCYRRQRDWEAAREDIDLALELCESLGDVYRSGEVTFQASLVAERQGRWVLARRYAETCRELLVSIGDTVGTGRVLNNLAGLNHSLGNDDVAIQNLREAFQIFVDANLEVEAGYVLSSLAEIQRSRGELAEAESAAARALALLEGRVDHVQEIGTAQLVLARTYLERGELEQAEDVLLSVDESYALTESISHRARSWMTRAELELARANEAEAARLYRQAAVALQPAEI